MKNLIKERRWGILKLNRKFMVWGLTGLVMILVVWGWVKSRNQTDTKSESAISDESTSASLGEIPLELGYTFKAMDKTGNINGEVNFRITKAEKTKEVLIQGKPATAKGKKAFLVLHFEIDNTDTQKLYLVPGDLVRLVGENEKRFAPDVHSNVVEIQPISTKITRVGFVVLESQNNFKIQVGELTGEKQIIEVNF